MLSPSSSLRSFILTTTRGSTHDVRGWLSIFVLDEEGNFRNEDEIRYETRTSGGRANAIDLLTKKDGPGFWVLLTDDDEVSAAVRRRGAVRVLEWDGMETGGLSVVAEWPGDGSDEEKICGASHAIWLD
jgi:carboxy-cis,cis-muconate cyclase